ncbi:OsmC family protein [Paenibacillus hunanensis]|uniref:OsmC family protein n=1 Tax=Paenibacillus hunanensis TaxID=539262 RepID=UPI002A69D9A4|nr:OsmC family protein [Paenibacillus hunanensis]WPP40588.1 OsmC family protein [Paenibacillus hunanensis]
MIHEFILDADWKGGRNSEGTISSGNLNTVISIPQPMGGPGTGTNPDEMLLGAAATCYIITLAAMLERSNITVEQLTMQSQGNVDVTNNIFTYKEIIHRPHVVLSADATAQELEKAELLAHKAEQSCMISRALAGNVQLSTEPNIHAAQPAE